MRASYDDGRSRGRNWVFYGADVQCHRLGYRGDGRAGKTPVDRLARRSPGSVCDRTDLASGGRSDGASRWPGTARVTVAGELPGVWWVSTRATSHGRRARSAARRCAPAGRHRASRSIRSRIYGPARDAEPRPCRRRAAMGAAVAVASVAQHSQCPRPVMGMPWLRWKPSRNHPATEHRTGRRGNQPILGFSRPAGTVAGHDPHPGMRDPVVSGASTSSGWDPDRWRRERHSCAQCLDARAACTSATRWA
ncbi:hypothetical protein ABIA39_003456 [Nocardia sp. GAS34]